MIRQALNDDILALFEKHKAILQGHFLLSSGLHSERYIQCAQLFVNPAIGESVCQLLAEKLRSTIDINAIDALVAPAMGGLLVGYELARQLGKPSFFCERVDGHFVLRRGFSLAPDMRVLVVEDVITTGKSSREAFACVEACGARVTAEACLVRRGSEVNLGVPIISLLEIDIPTYNADNLPPHLQNIPAEKPGSRFVRA